MAAGVAPTSVKSPPPSRTQTDTVPHRSSRGESETSEGTSLGV